MTILKSARAVADISEGVVLAAVDIDAPPERVFAALTTAEVAKWWGSPQTYRVTRWSADLKKGGTWRSDGVGSDGKPFSVGGEILEVDPPRLLVQTWKYDWGSGGSSRLRYRITPTATGSRLTVRHEGFDDSADCESHADGWESVLDWLAGYLGKSRA